MFLDEIERSRATFNHKASKMTTEHEINSLKETIMYLSGKLGSLNLVSTQPSTDKSLMEKLKEHKLYFIEWIRDEPVTVEDLPHLISKLYLYVPTVDLCEDELEELTELTNTTIQSAGAGLVEAFLCIQAQKFQGAKQIIETVEIFLNHCVEFIPTDYMSGFGYVISLLKLHLRLVDGRFSDKSEIDKAEKLLLLSPDDLRPVQYATILILQWQLNELFDSRKAEAVTYGLAKIHQLDPENWLWGYLLNSRLRFLRRQNQNSLSYPKDLEIEAIHAALKFAPLKYKPMAEAAACLCLAEILQFRRSKYQDNKIIVFGEITFQKNEGIAKFIVDKSKKALENKAVCFGELIRYGEILSSTIPNEFQDPLISEECLRSALEITPENSKANHRLGLILLKWKKDKIEALEHFEKAVFFAPSNFPAYIDLVTLLLSEQGDAKYTGRLKEVFDDIKTKNKSITKAQQATLLVFKGLFHLLSGDEDTALTVWLDKFALDEWEEYPSFINLPKIFQRYLFSGSTQQLAKEKLEKILKTIVKNIGSARSFECRALQCLRNMIQGLLSLWDRDRENCIKYDNNEQRQQVHYYQPQASCDYKQKQKKSYKSDSWKKQRPTAATVLPPPSRTFFGKKSPSSSLSSSKTGQETNYYYNPQRYSSPTSNSQPKGRKKYSKKRHRRSRGADEKFYKRNDYESHIEKIPEAQESGINEIPGE